MSFRRISSFDGAANADALLGLPLQALAEIVLQHLKSPEPGVMQNGMINRRYFIAAVEGRNMGFGISDRSPEFGARQPEVSNALEEAWDWMVKESWLMRVPEQPAEWYRITRHGEACLKRLGG
jgi:hypothetical protein